MIRTFELNQLLNLETEAVKHWEDRSHRHRASSLLTHDNDVQDSAENTRDSVQNGTPTTKIQSRSAMGR